MARRIDPRRHGQHQSDDDDLPRMARAEIDDADNDGGQHGVGFIRSPGRSFMGTRAAAHLALAGSTGAE